MVHHQLVHVLIKIIYNELMTAILSTDFYQPFKEDELEQSTEVQIIFPSEQKPVIIIIIMIKRYFPSDLTVFG